MHNGVVPAVRNEDTRNVCNDDQRLAQIDDSIAQLKALRAGMTVKLRKLGRERDAILERRVLTDAVVGPLGH